MTEKGRVTLPIEVGMDEEIKELMERLGADAVRNSDGTELPAVASELFAKVYSTYFPARGDNDWAKSRPLDRTHFYLMSKRIPALTEGELVIDVMDGYFAQQVSPDTDVDVTKMWQVIDRTTGETISPSKWSLVDDSHVKLAEAIPGHVYTVNFFAKQMWDSTQMYNYITNDWHLDPKRCKEMPYDVRIPETWEHMQSALKQWCLEHPEVDVVRFTTFFYHFTLVFNHVGKEKFVDWFGYSASVSESAMDEFAKVYGYELTPEDFVDEGYYNNPFRSPKPQFLDWMDFTHRFVTEKAKELVKITHEAGKEAMMFLGDNWIGMEPYGPYFPEIGMDAVVGSVGSAATCRMISDIPGVKYTEGRFLPYFFPDVFNAEGDPIGEANRSWLDARRAIVRSPLDRMGYGGYLSLAVQFPDFVNRVEQICEEFRQIHIQSEGIRPADAPFTVGVLNAWGKIRSWQTHMVAHALWYKQIYTYLGVIESLAGLPFEVKFLSFEDVENGVPDEIGVLINAGSAGTAFSGDLAWGNTQLVTTIRQWVADGGAFIGVGEPSAYQQNGAFLQLSDVLGVERETHLTLNTDKYHEVTTDHFITADLAEAFDDGEGGGDVYALDENTKVLAMKDGSVQIAAHAYGHGRAVYLSGLPYSSENSRLLHRALYWAANREQTFENNWHCDNIYTEVAYYPSANKIFVYNNTEETQSTRVHGHGKVWTAILGSAGSQWIDLNENPGEAAAGDNPVSAII
ncbi:1,3-beta-galactosyl-N-acetylhexosamine phosphorylase [Boudabousia tangfeifanii]|uniref:1,3-beta-galactosyl-N-acetylhexosamine phosphorylase n=1 Tax=Boudabousia tangfeifanii TaxID=1912795 RepID=A0A1D9MKP3_9ACTO|nr:1,3-beta-galactosyl-N-acetylhexosamine phosphorylase [Boudabousia tangfeifanii]AOZ72730.1 1,3-beta-galactosyl-N-acetylhexosamine phosphorylase [Boudabousia tangfeifanii]